MQSKTLGVSFGNNLFHFGNISVIECNDAHKILLFFTPFY